MFDFSLALVFTNLYWIQIGIVGAGAVCGCGVRPLQNQCAHTCVCGSESGSAVCVRATRKRVATHPLGISKIRQLYFIQGWHALSSLNTFPLGTLILCLPEHFTPQQILLPGTFYSLTQFAPWNTLLPGTFCSLELYALCIFFSPQYTLFSKQSTPVTIVFKGEKCSKKQSVPGSKVICDIKSTQWLGSKCSREQNNMWSKVCVNLQSTYKMFLSGM